MEHVGSITSYNLALLVFRRFPSADAKGRETGARGYDKALSKSTGQSPARDLATTASNISRCTATSRTFSFTLIFDLTELDENPNHFFLSMVLNNFLPPTCVPAMRVLNSIINSFPLASYVSKHSLDSSLIGQPDAKL